MVTEFGDPVQVVTDPGLGTKYPYQSVRKFDARLYVHTPAFSEFLTLDKTAVIASGVVLWRVEDPRKYFETVFNRAGAESRLSDILFAELGAAIGRNPLSAFVGTAYRAEQILADVAQRCRDTARRDYGIDVVDVQLQRFDFPERNRLRVYARMKSERAQISMKYRSEGEEEGLKIRAEADEEGVRIRSEPSRSPSSIAARARPRLPGSMPRRSRRPRISIASCAVRGVAQVLGAGTTLVLPANSELFGLLYDSNHYQDAAPWPRALRRRRAMPERRTTGQRTKRSTRGDDMSRKHDKMVLRLSSAALALAMVSPALAEEFEYDPGTPSTSPIATPIRRRSASIPRIRCGPRPGRLQRRVLDQRHDGDVQARPVGGQPADRAVLHRGRRARDTLVVHIDDISLNRDFGWGRRSRTSARWRPSTRPR